MKKMKFLDGEHPVEVGQKVFIRSGQGRRGYSYEGVIQKVGRELVTVGRDMNSRGYKFYMSDGTQQTEMGAKDCLYSSEEAFNRVTRERAVIDSVAQFFRDNFGPPKITYQQALQIREIIGLKDEEQDTANSASNG